jgi:ATP-dependent Lhr-like helicase
MADHAALQRFSPAVRAWFSASFPEPTAAQVQGWEPIRDREHTLICAPTGSGKTLAAFLSAIDQLVTDPVPEQLERTRVLYLSPLRALAFDVEKNLRAPLGGIRLAADRLGESFNAPTVAMRTGDTPSRERQALLRHPADLLITTPESLYLMLTSSARTTLANVHTVIVDEIHALAPTKRGAHMAVSLERLEQLVVDGGRPAPQRIGLSATQRPLEEVARFLGGFSAPGVARPVRIVDAGIRKPLDVSVIVPVEDMANLGGAAPGPRPVAGAELRSGPASAAATSARASIWPSIYPKVLELVLAHRSTIIFCNARRQAERLAARLNELYEETAGSPETAQYRMPEVSAQAGSGIPGELVRAHHGSLAREQRVVIEDQLKRGELRAIVATSSLELGIDMGAVDQVIQVESPGAVSRGLQRIGRAGHSVGEPSKGAIFPKHRGDLVEAAIVTRRMIDGEIEHTHYLRNPLDVLAQQIVAHVAIETECGYDDVAAMIRRTATFADLSDALLANTIDLLAGRYPSDEFAELRPRLVWDRVGGRLRARDGSRMLAVTSGGTIPDRGLFGVFLPDGKRVGELDEEMVYESRVGETFLLGASTWRIEEITHERVVVTPAPGQPGKMPFWHGDRPGRPLELGRALGAFVRELRALSEEAALDRLQQHYNLDLWAATNLLDYLDDQREATGAVPDDRTIVVERFRDEIGDWRVVIHSPFGTPVHAPWAMAIERRLSERFDWPIETMWSDDGIVIRLPEAADHIPVEELLISPEEVEELVVDALGHTALFAARFRECAARSLLLPRKRPNQRSPLWQQRQRAGNLLAVAAKYPTFPILLEASRECLNDVFDLPALREVLGQLQSRTVRLVSVDTQRPSPFAQSLLFSWIATYMYEGDAPLAERRAAALALDRDLLRELLGAEELRELLDPGVLADVELELQRLADGRRARSADELHDVLRIVGDLAAQECDLRSEEGPVAEWLAQLVHERRAITIAIPGAEQPDRYIAAEDAARYRDAFGCALPLGLPREFTEPVPRPLEDLVGRYARTHAPFTAAEVARRFGVPIERAQGALSALESDGRVVHGEFRPGGAAREWCDDGVLRQLRRRSLAILRKEVEPVEPEALARFLPRWHRIAWWKPAPAPRRSISGALLPERAPSERPANPEALVEAIAVLQGAALVVSSLDDGVLAARVPRYKPVDLDQLCAAGDVVWVGAGALGANDGRIRLFFADQLAQLAPGFEPLTAPDGLLHETLRQTLAERGACFYAQLRAAAPEATQAELLGALWDLVWSGEVTNDSLQAVRAYVGGGGPKAGAPARRSGAARPGRLTRIAPPAAAGRWSLVAPLLEPRPTTTQALHAMAAQLLDRHGVVTREAVLAESVVGGFAGVYGVLRALEERGTVRRGYFVSGLGAAQFALPGAVDRLRSDRDADDIEAGEWSASSQQSSEVAVLAATDPAQVYGAGLPWPDTDGRPSRSAGAIVVLAGGLPLVWFDTRSHHLVGFDAAVHDTRWADVLASTVPPGSRRKAEVRKINGSPIDGTHPLATALLQAGFIESYRGLVAATTKKDEPWPSS